MTFLKKSPKNKKKSHTRKKSKTNTKTTKNESSEKTKTNSGSRFALLEVDSDSESSPAPPRKIFQDHRKIEESLQNLKDQREQNSNAKPKSLFDRLDDHEAAMKRLKERDQKPKEEQPSQKSRTQKESFEDRHLIPRYRPKLQVEVPPPKPGSLFDRCVPAEKSQSSSSKSSQPRKPTRPDGCGPWSPKRCINKKLRRDSQDRVKINNSEFCPAQIEEFKKSFDLLDADKDGVIDFADLQKSCDEILNIPEKELTSQSLNDMVRDCLVPINFSIFLNILGERLYGTDPEDTILEAFRVFDPEKTGRIDKKFLSEILQMQADRFTEEELEEMYKICESDEDDVDYENLVHILCFGESSPVE